MEKYFLYIIQTIIVVIAYFALKFIIKKATIKTAQKLNKSDSRLKIVLKVINFILGVIGMIVVITIWGVKQSDIALFLTSILTVIGIAFFAQWSIISNITSAFIIFFNHPAKIGEEIEIFDKDFPVKGTISDIGIFFITVHTEQGNLLTIPSNVFIQKMIVKK